MLLFVFRAGMSRFAVNAAQIQEVCPFPTLLSPPEAVPGFPGWCNFRGQVTPVLDLTWRLSGQTWQPSLGTRLLLVDIARDDAKLAQPLLFAVERFTATVRCEDSQLQLPGVHLPDSPYLHRIFVDNQGLIQILDVTKVINEAFAQALLITPGGHDGCDG